MRKLKLYDTDDNLILSYTTDHEFHGSQLIEITGPVLIGKCLVDYLAKINGEFGIVTFDQPIETPLYTRFCSTTLPIICRWHTTI